MKKQVLPLLSAGIWALLTGFPSEATNVYVPNSVSIDKTKEVGEIPIQSGVTPAGAVTYSVPIEVYPGIHGMQPQLAIAYNSMAGNGLPGMGWSLSGLSSILRAPMNFYYDGMTQPVGVNQSDAFYLDGMRLIATSSTATQIKYQSEQGNILATANLNGTVVKYFDVFFPNGTKGTYGYTTNSATSYLEYPLTSISDLYGNTISYAYTYADNHYRISKISYANASVEFAYATRPDILLSYTAGLKVMEDQRLNTVACKYGTVTLRTYTMGYMLSRNVSTLTSISCSAANGYSFNPLQFYYDHNTAADFPVKTDSAIISGSYYSTTSQGKMKVARGKFDYNTGDDGLIVTQSKNPYYQSAPTLFSNQYTGTETIYFYTGLGSSSAKSTTLTTGAGFVDIFCANLDGQGKDEIIKVNNTVNSDAFTFTVYAPGASGLTLKYARTFNLQAPIIDNIGNISPQPKFYYTGDFNGDGKMEVFAVSCHNPFGYTNYPSKCYLFDLEANKLLYEGASFPFQVAFEGIQNNATSALNNTDRLFVGDFDGDGKSEICLINTNGTQIYKINVSGPTFSLTYSIASYALYTGLKRSDLQNRVLLMGELNGDGKLDLLLSSLTTNTNDVSWSLFYSMGNGQYDKIIFSCCGNSGELYLQDVDGDGRSDLLKPQGNYLLTLLSNNNTFYSSCASTAITANPIIILLEINGKKYNNQLIILKDNVVNKYAFAQNDAKEYSLVGMISSLGVVNKNNYKMLYPSSPFYTMGSAAKFPYDNFQGPLFVLESKEQYLNGARTECQGYQYINAVIHRQGRGFCGFEKITAIDSIRGNRASVQTYDPYNFSVLKSRDSYLALDTFSYSISVAANKIASVLMTNQYSLNKPKNITINHSYSNYNAYGYPANETLNYGGGITESISNSYINNTNETGYLLGFLIDHTKTTTRNGATWAERFVSPSYSNGQPTYTVKYVNGNQVAIETFSYNSQGNDTIHGVKPYSSTTTLTTKYVYDSYGRLKTETDPLGFNTTYDYDPSNGSLSKKTNYKGQATSFGYDAFFRQTGYTYPEGTTGSTVYSWTAAGTNGLYCIQKSETGKPTTKACYDALGRETASTAALFNNTESRIDKLYDSYGRLSKVSLPFTGTAASYWNTYGYDGYDRPTLIREASGRTTSYVYNGVSVTTTKDGIASTQTFDTQGNLISASDPAGTITYNLRPDGQPSSIVAPGSVATSFTYDNYGRRLTIVDPSAGTLSTTYDAAGNVYTETDANSKTVTYGYDSYNRLTSKALPEFTVRYRYDSDGLLASDSISSTTFTSYMYDTYGRLSKEKETVPDGKWLEKTRLYANGRLDSVRYVSQTGTLAAEKYLYAAGHLTEIKLNGTSSIWKLNAVNAFGQPTSVIMYQGSYAYNYSAYGIPTNINNPAFTFEYGFDSIKRNLTYRKDIRRNFREDFTYDNLNRLTTYSGYTAAYNLNGNINSKTDIGSFQYAIAGKPYALSGVTSPTNLIPQRDQTVTYTSFKRPALITEAEYTAAFTYNGQGGRVKMEMKKNGAKELTRYYLSDCYEIDDRAVGGIKEKLYLGGDFYTAPVVYVKDGAGSWTLYNIFRDYLGSIIGVSNGSTTVQELSYDAWGQLRNPANQTDYAPGTAPELFLGRGYTGHEHLPQFGLINMNARLYDPAVGRFLSPDPYVQSPNFSQSLNRYSYALNNPLRYNDPTGEKLKWWQALVGFCFFDPVGTMTLVGSALATVPVAAGTAQSVDFAVTYVGSFYKGSEWGGQ